MADDAAKKIQKDAPGLASNLRAWGESPLPPTVLATLITAQHARPFQALPMLFPVALMGATYMNLNDAKVDAAGFSAAWAGLYALLASRRKQGIRNKFGPRGILRGGTIIFSLAQVAAGGWVYGTGRGLGFFGGK